MSHFEFKPEHEEQVDASRLFHVMFYEMGFCYSEVRSYLANSLKLAVERSRHKQIDSNNFLHFEHHFYQGGIHMQILLDVAEKHSIYDRSKLLWQLCSDLEASKEFMND